MARRNRCFRKRFKQIVRYSGSGDPATLGSIGALALLYQSEGRYTEAEQLFQEVLQTNRKAFGQRHPATITSLANLAAIYSDQALRHAQGGTAASGSTAGKPRRTPAPPPGHPTGLNNLAFLYVAQGRYGEAEPLYQEALQARREVLGPRHPDTLVNPAQYDGAPHQLGRSDEAVRMLQQMEPHLLGWIGQELYSTEVVLAPPTGIFAGEGPRTPR